MPTDQGNQHGPRVDEQMARESEALTHGAPDDGRTEFRRDQAPGDDQPETIVSRGAIDIVLDRRSELAAALSSVEFPATKGDLVSVAAEAYLPDAVTDVLEGLPGGTVFENFADVWKALGGPDLDT